MWFLKFPPLVYKIVVAIIMSILFIEIATRIVENKYLKEQVEVERKIQTIQEENHAKHIQAIQNTLMDIKRTNDEYIDTIDSIDGLFGELDSLAKGIDTMSRDAKAQYENTLRELFKDCTTRYTELAKKADAHTNDIKQFQYIYSLNPVEPLKFP